MDTFALNPNPIPIRPRTASQHHRFINMLMILTAATLIVGTLYWWTSSGTTENAPQAFDRRDPIKLQVANALRDSHTHVSQQEIDSVAAQLSASKHNATAADRQAVAEQLK